MQTNDVVVPSSSASRSSTSPGSTPVIDIAIALNIARENLRLVRQSTDGLLDRSLPNDELDAFARKLSRFASPEIHIEGVRTRRAGHAAFMTAIMTVRSDWSVARPRPH